jgi:hypothetical protein
MFFLTRSMDQGAVAPYYDWFDRALALRQPALAELLLQTGMHLHDKLIIWLQTVFVTLLPLATAVRVWDMFLLVGTPYLLRTGLAVMDLLAPELLKGDADHRQVILTQPKAMRSAWMPSWSSVYDADKLLAAVDAVTLPQALMLELEDLLSDRFFYRHVGSGAV